MELKLSDEAEIIKTAVVLYWDCNVCKRLGWNNSECDKLEGKERCADIVYRNLRQHFYNVIKRDYSR